MTESTERPRRPMVLVVDDEAAVRRLIARILHEGGYEVIEAGDGLQALKIVEDDLWPIDLVLTDIKMPVLDGIRLGQAIADLRPDLSLAYMSGFGSEVTNLLRTDLREQCFIAKPFSSDAILALVQRCLKPPATAEA
jgi:two-component system cell cycle sensor histidine kinase/response regulator CckA